MGNSLQKLKFVIGIDLIVTAAKLDKKTIPTLIQK